MPKKAVHFQTILTATCRNNKKKPEQYLVSPERYELTHTCLTVRDLHAGQWSFRCHRIVEEDEEVMTWEALINQEDTTISFTHTFSVFPTYLTE